eukprot:SAG11_NODE_1701_length_4423_cov_2.759713_2_plen_717_part_00
MASGGAAGLLLQLPVLAAWLSSLQPQNTVGLRDFPLAGDAASPVVYLDSGDGHATWIGSSRTSGLSIAANVPGDIISDLHAAGAIPHPYYETTWKNSTAWVGNDWTYTATFPSADAVVRSSTAVLLVFDGVKMGATISLNGVQLGVARNQFVRHRYDVTKQLRPAGSSNTLRLSFNNSINTAGRFMACSGQADWAPYSNTFQAGGTPPGRPMPTFSFGIVKSVYLAPVARVAITDLVPHVFYRGSHPTTILTPSTQGDFEVHVTVHVWAASAAETELVVAAEWGQRQRVRVSHPKGESNASVVLRAPAGAVKLWWPRGVGGQPLFRVNATLVDAVDGTSAAAGAAFAERSIGFRVVALVTGNDTDPHYVARAASEEGSDTHGMYLRVNGALIFARGGSMVPMDELDGWLDADAHVAALESAAAAQMNTIRLWGGGTFMPKAWYEACDRLGLLVYHDMMYCHDTPHGPRNSSEQAAELRHQIRRLSHHPSIAIWDGCNECISDFSTWPMQVVLTTVAGEDQSRPIWPACPAHGWQTGVHKLTSLPKKGSVLRVIPGALSSSGEEYHIEYHGPYLQGSGFPAVNGKPQLSLPDPAIPHNFAVGSKWSPPAVGIRIGPAYPNVFVSEFGVAGMCSFESLSPMLAPNHWSLHGNMPWDTCNHTYDTGNDCSLPGGGTNLFDGRGTNVMAQRNYPCDSLIFAYFGRVLVRQLNDGRCYLQL